MRELTFWDRIKDLLFLKNLVYKFVLPVYLWTINYRSLDDYCDDIYRFEHARRESLVNRRGLEK